LQPFPSVVIELPYDHTRKRVVPFEEGNHAPDFVIVRHEPEAGCMLVSMHLTSHQVLTRLLKLDPAWTLEEMWQKGQRTWGAADSLGMTPEEAALGNALSKLALNVCLMATAYGVRCLGHANPSYYERLKRYAKLARKRGPERQQQAEAELRAAPVRYAFAQEVTLYHREQVTDHQEVGEKGGWTVTPGPAAPTRRCGGAGSRPAPPPSTSCCAPRPPPARRRRAGPRVGRSAGRRGENGCRCPCGVVASGGGTETRRPGAFARGRPGHSGRPF
jgi:hypothetical protein